MIRPIYIFLIVALITGCSQSSSRQPAKIDDQTEECTMPVVVTDASSLLLESTKPSSEVDQALDLISEYEDKSMRVEKTIKIADGSLHTGLQQRYPQLGIRVDHYDQKFTHASRIPVAIKTKIEPVN